VLPVKEFHEFIAVKNATECYDYCYRDQQGERKFHHFLYRFFPFDHPGKYRDQQHGKQVCDHVCRIQQTKPIGIDPNLDMGRVNGGMRIDGFIREQLSKHHRIKPVVQGHQQYQRGKWKASLYDHQEERPVDTEFTKTCFFNHNEACNQGGNSISCRLRVNKPFDPETGSGKMSPQQYTAEKDHEETVEHREDAVGFKHQQT
jgi:hypothetical protein